MAERKSPLNGQPLPRGKPFEAGEQAREAGRRGGIKSQEKQKAMRTLREELEALLAEERPDKSGKVMTVQAGITASLVAQAVKGNVKAYEVIRDTIGQKPEEKVVVHQPDFTELDKIAAELMGK